MSVKLLQHPGKVHMLTDDLESFLHVLGWMTLRYVPAIGSYSALRRGKDMVMFDEHFREQGHSGRGGEYKALAFEAGRYPSRIFQPRCQTPLLKLVQELSQPFKSLYGNPLTEDDRTRVQVRPDGTDRVLYRLWDTIDQYDQDIRHLGSQIWFSNEIKKALDEEVWPADDEADVNLPIAFDNDTDRQVQNKISQLQNTQSVWERSKGLSMNSKRAGSPTPEPSTKCRRGTPAASGSGV